MKRSPIFKDSGAHGIRTRNCRFRVGRVCQLHQRPTALIISDLSRLGKSRWSGRFTKRQRCPGGIEVNGDCTHTKEEKEPAIGAGWPLPPFCGFFSACLRSIYILSDFERLSIATCAVGVFQFWGELTQAALATHKRVRAPHLWYPATRFSLAW